MDEDDAHGGPTFGGFRLSERRRCLIDASGREMALRPRSLALFRALAETPDTVLGRDALLEAVWGHAHVTDDALGKSVGEIRRAIGDDERAVLRTIPRQGYMLVSDDASAEGEVAADADGTDATTEASTSVGTASAPRAERPRRAAFLHPRRLGPFRLAALATLALVAAALLSRLPDAGVERAEADAVDASPAATSGGALAYRSDDAVASKTRASDAAPTLALRLGGAGADGAPAAALLHAVRAALARYRTVRLSGAADADLVLAIDVLDPEAERVAAELLAPADDALLFAETFELAEPEAERLFGPRLAAMVASPASGRLARHLLARSRDVDPDALSAPECYAHGYDCTNCSGELDTVDRSAAACLARLVREDPTDARARALEATVHAHRYQWGTGLSEPAYSDFHERADLPPLAIAAANRAEQLSDGTDSAVYWGMAQAYQTTCEIDKLRTAVDRGLAINPDDPNLLGAFGNWLAYAGDWDRGAAMAERALEIEPTLYRPWWLFAIAKRHYVRGEYEEALEWFGKAFNERNWLSHLQLAYTLPHLGRLGEAREALARAENLLPGITIEYAVRLYAVYCFPEEYLERMVEALEAVGMPTRGDYSNLRDPEVPHARLLSIGDWDVEYMDLGEGVPIVFVHGAMSDYRTWGHYQNPVSAEHRYVSYSRRYHGSQPWPDAGEKSGPANAGRDLGDFIDALGLGRVFLVGWSSGADPALHLALERPELVAGIVLYEPVINSVIDETDEDYPRAAHERFSARFARVAAAVEAGHDEAATRAFLENVFEYPDGGFERETMAVRRVVLDNARTVPLRFARWRSTLDCDDLGGVVAPTLVVVGERTHDAWQYLSRKFARCLPDATLETFGGVRHDGPIRKPLELFATIERFVDAVSARGER